MPLAARRELAPASIPGFEHVNRYWDRTRGRSVAKIMPGEYYVASDGEPIATTLGSCVSACIFDPVSRLGGMNHFMLPESNEPSQAWGSSLSTRFGAHAMEHLINDLMKHGARRDRLKVKLTGGGRVLQAMTDIGEKNIRFVQKYVVAEGLELVSSDLGETVARKVFFHPDTGRMLVKKLQSLNNATVIERETRYRDSLRKQPEAGDVELF